MVPDPKPHTLIRIDGPQALRAEAGGPISPPAVGLPTWAAESLRRAPWVVVRRAQINGGLIPVGVRGESRQQRFAAWLSPDDALEVVTPQALVSSRAWALAAAADPVRHRTIAALVVRDRVERVMCEHGLAERWGPGGSVGFELASGKPTVTSSNDLDLVLELDRLDLIAGSASSLGSALTGLPVRVDVLLETPEGAVVLSEYVRVCRSETCSFVLRSSTGPRLIQRA